MTVYELHFVKELKIQSLTNSDSVEINLKTNNKKVLDYWDKIFNELLSEEHYLDYLKEETELEDKK